MADRPVARPGFVAVPGLQAKLRWLFGRHPKLRTQGDLAAALGISPSIISGWINGTATTDREVVPTRYIFRLCELFDLPRQALEAVDFEDFKHRLEDQPAPRAWERLLSAVPEARDLEIVASARRGISEPEEDAEGLPRFAVGDEIMFRLSCPGRWHLLLLLQDRFGWSCLCPSRRVRETLIEGGFVHPRPDAKGHPRFARLDSIGGLHRLVAVLTAGPLPAADQSALGQGPLDADLLDRVAAGLAQGQAGALTDIKVMSRRFFVAPA